MEGFDPIFEGSHDSKWKYNILAQKNLATCLPKSMYKHTQWLALKENLMYALSAYKCTFHLRLTNTMQTKAFGGGGYSSESKDGNLKTYIPDIPIPIECDTERGTMNIAQDPSFGNIWCYFFSLNFVNTRYVPTYSTQLTQLSQQSDHEIKANSLSTPF